MKTRVRKFWDERWGIWMYAVDWWRPAYEWIPEYVSVYSKEERKPTQMSAAWWEWPTHEKIIALTTYTGWRTPDEKAALNLAQRLSVDPKAQVNTVIIEFSDGIEFKPVESKP